MFWQQSFNIKKNIADKEKSFYSLYSRFFSSEDLFLPAELPSLLKWTVIDSAHHNN